MAQILDGKLVSNILAEKLLEEVEALEVKPCLAIIQVGDDPRSSAYIRRKMSLGEKIGARVLLHQLPASVTEERLIESIENLNKDNKTHGIIVQLPLPESFNKEKIIEAISPLKDVDGLTSGSLFVPATARGVVSLLQHYNIAIEGKLATVVGRSALVGKPTTKLLEELGARVTVAHRETKDLGEATRNSDILVVATGVPKLIKEEHVRRGQTVIDVGISIEESRLVGDVDFEKVKDTVENITPVPGGVGPMTVVSLFENLLEAYRKQTSSQ